MDALQHYQEAQRLLADPTKLMDGANAHTQEAVAHALLSIAATLGNLQPSSSTGWHQYSNGPNSWLRATSCDDQVSPGPGSPRA